jgi:hypothetical protein
MSMRLCKQYFRLWNEILVKRDISARGCCGELLIDVSRPDWVRPEFTSANIFSGDLEVQLVALVLLCVLSIALTRTDI